MCIRDSVASIPALLSLLVAGCGIAFAFFKYGKKDATGQQVSWDAVSYTHLRAHETVLDLVCRLLLEKKKNMT